jgi:hypothetical protein
MYILLRKEYHLKLLPIHDVYKTFFMCNKQALNIYVCVCVCMLDENKLNIMMICATVLVPEDHQFLLLILDGFRGDYLSFT